MQSLGPGLGAVLVVYVGYNESATGYGKGIDQIMRAATAQGVKGVVWVTLREQRDTYRWTNIAIRTAAKRWPQLQVADWNAYSAGKPWFNSDGSTWVLRARRGSRSFSGRTSFAPRGPRRRNPRALHVVLVLRMIRTPQCSSA